jgi:peptidoglycan hydrolase-like protein with peptidoglycan-binding domain
MAMHAKHTGWVAFLLALLLALGTFGGAVALADDVWFTRSGTRMRDSASTNGNPLALIKGGDSVTLLGKSGAWSRVQYEGKTGYVRADLLVQVTRSGYIPLEEGNDCPQVKELETRLKTLGFFTGTPDALYKADTTTAVKAFQKRNSITQDGIAGGETQRLLYATNAIAAENVVVQPLPTPATATTTTAADGGTTTLATSSTLRKGDTGTAVKAMQTQLKALGYITFTPDGVYGDGTERAVIEFQKRNSLKADGLAGSATLKAMSATSAVKAATVTAAATVKILKRGDSGAEVKLLQQRL